MAFEEGGNADGGANGGGASDLLGGATGAAGGGADGGQGGGANDGGAGDGQGGAGGAGEAPDWFGNVSDKPGEGETTSNRDYLAAKGVKDLDGLVKMTRDTEKALRENGRVKVPGEGAKPEEVAAFHAAIGVPDSVEGYQVEAPEGVKLDDSVIGALRESALKNGTPAGAFKGLVSDFVKIQIEQADAAKQEQDAQAAAWMKEQGGKTDEQIAHINSAARSLGLTKEDMSWFRGMPGGTGRALGLLAKLGSGMAEDVLTTGGSNRFGITGSEAQAEIDRLKGDDDFQAKNKPGSPERARWDRLNRQAAEYKAAKDE